MTTGEWIQVILMGLLVVITGIYAWRTQVISKVTRKQAEASVTMAKETREQRYSECLPLLVPTVPPMLKTEELPYESLQSGVGMKVIWCNVGRGVAINSRFSFWTAPTSRGKATFFPPRESGTLKVGGKEEVDYSEILNGGQMRDISDAYRPRAEAEYLDIYERKVTTVQEFRVDEQKTEAFLGELYFTVNGRRLGEEAAQHD